MYKPDVAILGTDSWICIAGPTRIRGDMSSKPDAFNCPVIDISTIDANLDEQVRAIMTENIKSFGLTSLTSLMDGLKSLGAFIVLE